jgi:hypothetical protein
VKKFLCCLALMGLTAAASAADPAWETFTSKEGKYSIALPGKVKEKTVDNGVTTVRSILLEGKDLLYTLAAGDIPNVEESSKEAGFADAWLTRQRDRAVQKGKLLKEEKVTLDEKYPGRDLTIEPTDKDNLIRIRMVMSGKRFYQITVTGPKKAVESEDADKFLKSFKIVDK